jgi:solute:Na+ symporter, SSS family
LPDFFLAGREMSAWIVGISFLAANMGALELMGWAASAYEYGILTAHWYWIGAIPAMLFLAIAMMAFYYISRTHSVPGYLRLRFGETTRMLSGLSFAGMTVLMSGINMFAMAKVMGPILPERLSAERAEPDSRETAVGFRTVILTPSPPAEALRFPSRKLQNL